MRGEAPARGPARQRLLRLASRAGFDRIDTFGSWGGTYGERLSGTPINPIEVVGDHLYVANSRDGLVVVRVDAE